MHALGKRAGSLAGSLGLSCCLLLLLGLLTWLGTLEQARSGLYEVQRKYFESFVLLHDVGPFSVPLPGANLVLSLLALNLVVGGVLRIAKRRSTVGVMIVHAGILLMLAAGFAKWRFSSDGQITLYEGQSAAHFEDPYRFELSIVEHRESGEQLEYRVPQETLVPPRGVGRVRLRGEGLPFVVEVADFARNARVQRKGPMFVVAVPVIEGLFLQQLEPELAAERNIAGAYLSLIGAGTDEPPRAIVWGAQAQPWSVRAAGRSFSFDLRRERHALPFAIELDDFAKLDHPGTSLPASFTSDVTVRAKGSESALRISMNEPLRRDGLVVYQASWGPQGAAANARLFSTFAVVRNPADQWPLVSCVVITLGMLLHFGRKLRQALRLQAAAR